MIRLATRCKGSTRSGTAQTPSTTPLYRTVRIVDEDPDGVGSAGRRSTAFRYDPAHQLIATTDPLGRVTSLAYDQLGRAVREIAPDPDGPFGPSGAPVMTYTYDAMNNKTVDDRCVG